MRHFILLALVSFVSVSCGKKDDKKMSTVNAKLRSTGISSLGLALDGLFASALNNSRSTSLGNILRLDYYKVPIRRINLVTGGKTGGGYTGTSPNFYTCDSSKTDTECLVDLSSAITVDNLLAGNSSTEVEMEDAVAYDGAAVEFCKDGSSGSTYNILVKGSVVLGSTTYYTSATAGLSSSLTAAEEVAIPVSCSGMTTYFNEPYTMSPETTTSLVIYADPSGNAFGVSGSSAKSLANSNCTGEDSLAVCSGIPSIFVTVDTATPTVERYLLDVTTTSSTTSSAYRDVLVKLLFDSADKPIGATVQEFFRNDTAAKSLHTAFMQMGGVTFKSTGIYDIGYGSDTFIANFKRGTDSGNTMSKVVTETLTFNQSKL